MHRSGHTISGTHNNSAMHSHLDLGTILQSIDYEFYLLQSIFNCNYGLDWIHLLSNHLLFEEGVTAQKIH